MIDMNDPEVIDSLKYLLVPKERKIQLAAMPYSSTKNFFVPCKEEGYECAEITKEAGDNISLMTRKGKVKKKAFIFARLFLTGDAWLVSKISNSNISNSK
jgi:hypothetical protein